VTDRPPQYQYPQGPPLPTQQGGAPAPSRAAGWHPDPLGRHQLRFWDGAYWSDHVADRGVVSVDPMTPATGVYAAYGTQPAAPVQPKRRHTKTWVALGLIVVVLLLAVGGFALYRSRQDGAGSFARDLDEPGSTLVHTVRPGENTVLLIRVEPAERGFNPVIGVSTDEDTVDEYEDFFGDDVALPDDEFAGAVPDDSQLLAVSDSAEQGDTEVTFVPTPLGGDFQVLVTGAADTTGSFDVDITIQPFDGPDDGAAYLEALANQSFLEDFEPPRSPIEDILDDLIDD
jgi:hypothetical protein